MYIIKSINLSLFNVIYFGMTFDTVLYFFFFPSSTVSHGKTKNIYYQLQH